MGDVETESGCKTVMVSVMISPLTMADIPPPESPYRLERPNNNGPVSTGVTPSREYNTIQYNTVQRTRQERDAKSIVQMYFSFKQVCCGSRWLSGS